MTIKFTSDVDPDYFGLEKYLKSGALGDLSNAFNRSEKFDINSTIDSIEKNPWTPIYFSEKLKNELFEIVLPTRYDEPLHFLWLSRSVNEVKNTVQSMGIDTSRFPYYASIPTRKVNAYAANIPGSKRPFILFDSELTHYCSNIAQLIVQFFPIVKTDSNLGISTELEKIRNQVQNSPDVINLLMETLNTFIREGFANYSVDFLILPENYQQIYIHFLTAMMLFIVSHEFGHVYSKHINSFIGINYDLLPKTSTNSSHEKEFQADLIGQELVLRTANRKGTDPVYPLLGIHMFFLSLDLAENFKNVINGGKPEIYVSQSSDSHPSNYDRRCHLFTVLDEIAKPPDGVEYARNMVRVLEHLFSYVWDQIVINLSDHS